SPSLVTSRRRMNSLPARGVGGSSCAVMRIGSAGAGVAVGLGAGVGLGDGDGATDGGAVGAGRAIGVGVACCVGAAQPKPISSVIARARTRARLRRNPV